MLVKFFIFRLRAVLSWWLLLVHALCEYYLDSYQKALPSSLDPTSRSMCHGRPQMNHYDVWTYWDWVQLRMSFLEVFFALWSGGGLSSLGYKKSRQVQLLRLVFYRICLHEHSNSLLTYRSFTSQSVNGQARKHIRTKCIVHVIWQLQIVKSNF